MKLSSTSETGHNSRHHRHLIKQYYLVNYIIYIKVAIWRTKLSVSTVSLMDQQFS